MPKRITLAALVILAGHSNLAVAQLSSGFFSPINSQTLGNHHSNFGATGQDYPVAGVWHCGDDMICPEATEVVAIADGKIVYSSPSGWDDLTTGQNYGVVMQHHLDSGKVFYAVYGHLVLCP